MNPSDYRYDIFYNKWSLGNNLFQIIGLVSALLTNSLIIWLSGTILLFLIYVISIPNFKKQLPLIIGYANWITLIRFLMILGVIILWEDFSNILIFILLCVVIALDGLDGYIARRFQLASQVGERFDMEVDAFFVFILSYMYYKSGILPFWILIPGGLRFYYGILFTGVKTTREEKPGKRIRSTIAVLFFLSLLLPLVLQRNIYIPVVVVTSLLIITSFCISAFYLIKGRWSG